MEATERILEDLDYTLEKKLKGIVSLLKEEAYHWWHSVVRSMQAKRITWEYFQVAFQKKYLSTRYVKARKFEFIKLK